jgi:hypothetical protein
MNHKEIIKRKVLIEFRVAFTNGKLDTSREPSIP